MLKTALKVSTLVFCLTACSDASQDVKEQSFNQVIEGATQSYFAQRPEIATLYGVLDDEAGEGVMSRLSYYDPISELKRREALADVISTLEAVDRDPLSEGQRIAVNHIETEMRGALLPATVVGYGSVVGDYGNWFLPYAVSHLSGPHVEFQQILEDKHPLQNLAQAQAYVSRLEAYPAMIDGLIEKIHADQQMGVIPPDFVLARTINNLKNQTAAEPNENTLVNAFQAKVEENGLEGVEALSARVETLVAENFYPATGKLITILEALELKAGHGAGIYHLPNGQELYAAMITHLTDTTMTADVIHELGLSEVERIHVEMDVLLKQIGHTEGTVGERMQVMLNDPKYIYPNTDEGRGQLLASIISDLALANEQIPLWFGKQPDQEVEIKAVPAHRAQSGPGAYYNAPAKDGSRLGTVWVNLSNTARLPSYSLQTLTYHEANPGHHLQTILGLSDENPILSAVFYSNAAGEGWGLYAESLAAEMGLYENDPEDDLGRLQQELHRAVRLVVDTGMHAMGWSRERAIDYSITTEGIHEGEATAEIERYAVWPGQALGYKLGQLKILQLREQAREALGDKFDVRLFHDAVLESGALPLNILEDKINAWVEAQG